jgi:signal transduction histidine kinase
MADDGARTRMLAAAAHRNAKETLAELRDLARGIHPPVLDRGLSAALGSLAETSPVPVGLEVSLTARPSPAIEAIAYFCAAELLANVAKHSGASHATVGVADSDGRILMTVTDDGSGAARLAPGGGLAGLLERVQTVDGRLGLDSPPGGPTIVTVELPRHA